MKNKPNIVLINCDDLGYGDLGCYGSSLNRTPVIDKLAKEGVRFTDFYAGSSVCSPSRGAMLTGCYPKRIGFASFEGRCVLFPGQGIGLNPSETTIATMLKAEGYQTKLIGKWHCGDQEQFMPLNHGFDEYYGLPYSNDMGRQAGGNPDYPPLPLIENDDVLEEQPDQSSLTVRYTEQSVKFIRKNKDRPFFLYLAHMHVHLPLYIPQCFADKSQNGDYGAAVECVDWSTGVILHELEKLGLDNNTLVIFTSDNGARGDYGGSNAPLRGRKGTSWEGGYRVPCIIRWKGKINPAICNSLVASMEFLPTIAAITGAQLPKNQIDGYDISRSLMCGGEYPRETMLYYNRENLEAIRYKSWKLHINHSNKYNNSNEQAVELYNLETDVGETTDIANERPEIVEELKALLDYHRNDLGDSFVNIKGENIRDIGKVENPTMLTEYDENHPYIIAMYDKSDRG
ncbi:MAG: sulfatase [Firmicutes bacterium]|nr:sulfatase [Bacillota bacterium]